VIAILIQSAPLTTDTTIFYCWCSSTGACSRLLEIHVLVQTATRQKMKN